MFFLASTVAEGRELWKSDGTPAGTVIVRDIYPGPFDSSPVYITAFGAGVYFSAWARCSLPMSWSRGPRLPPA